MYENLTRLDLVGPALARALGDPGWERLEASLVSGGKSNLTFELTSAAGQAVLRRPPDGPLLPRAHDMAREARVQRALAATAVPVPAILFEDAGELIGVPFYVMEKVEGYVVRDALPAGYADSPRDRHAIADVLVDTLADLHAVDPDGVGLSGFGRPSGLGERQVRRWTEQWERSKNRDVPAVDELARRLRADPPPGPGEPSCTGISGSITACWPGRCRRPWRPCSTGNSPRWASRWPTSACSFFTGGRAATPNQ